MLQNPQNTLVGYKQESEIDDLCSIHACKKKSK